MKFKKKIVAALCGIGLMFGASGVINNAHSYQRLEKDGFVIKLDQAFYHKNKQVYSVAVWSEKSEGYYIYDGDEDVSYRYDPQGGWFKGVNKWKKVGDSSYESGSHTGSYTQDITYDEVPGKPRNVPTNIPLEFRIDFDKNEEYASGIFKDEKSAEEWANNMVEIFKSENYEWRKEK